MYEIPFDRLPPGFAESIATPPAEPPAAIPAATVVLLRDAGAGPEALLLKRHRSAGFVPGAYVFPGGRVDAADGDPGLLARVLMPPPEEPALRYWIAAVREAFEEAGVLLARDTDGRFLPDAGASPDLARWREALLADEAPLVAALEALDAKLDLTDVVYVAHWITPVAEPRRFDTRFFVARLPDGCTAAADTREMVDAQWLRPADALERFAAGRLPMVFPTVRTLESLAGYASVDDLLDTYRSRSVEPVLPRLVRTGTGVAIVVDD